MTRLKKREIRTDYLCNVCERTSSRTAQAETKAPWNGKCSGCMARDRAKQNLHPEGKSVNWTGSKYIPGYLVARWKRYAKKAGCTYTISLKALDQLWEATEGRCPITKLAYDRNQLSLLRLNKNKGFGKGNVQLLSKGGSLFVRQPKAVYLAMRHLIQEG